MAFTGLHPVVAIYATFMNRAFDQVLMDVALHKAGVTFVLDRAGVTGPDGPSHHGIWDLSLLQLVPGIRIAAPRDAETLKEELAEALLVADAPTVLRFPKGNVSATINSVRRMVDGVDVLFESNKKDVLLLAVGSMAKIALDVAQLLESKGVGVTVIDPRWVIPIAKSVVELAASHRLVVTIEDGLRVGGIGTRVRQEMRAAQVDTGLNEIGIPDEFIDHATRDQILHDAGLTPERIAEDILAQMGGERVPHAKPEN
jgi:1-deoxy-D-xylulose-5-phosphate synthase